MNVLNQYKFKAPFRFTIVGDSFTIPTKRGYSYDAVVLWGDGESSNLISWGTGNTHIFASSSTWQITIYGKVGAWSFNNAGDKDKLISVDAAGDCEFDYLENAFFGCSNLKTLSVAGLVSNRITSLQNFANECRLLESVDVAEWDTRNVISFSYTFRDCNMLAILDVSKLDTSSTISVYGMIVRCYLLTEIDTSNWDTSNISSCGYMCYYSNAITSYFSPGLWWDRFPTIDSFVSCFQGAPNISNFSDIPNNWKGF